MVWSKTKCRPAIRVKCPWGFNGPCRMRQKRNGNMSRITSRGAAAYPSAKRYFAGPGRAHALGTLLPLPLRVYEASQALIYTCMTIVLMRSARLFPAAPYARMNVSSVRTQTDVTGAARHAHTRFMRAHGRPARANSDSIRPPRDARERPPERSCCTHAPPAGNDSRHRAPFGRDHRVPCRHDLRTDRQGRASMCEAKIRAFGRAVMGGAHLALKSPPPHVDLELQSSRRGVRRGCRPPRIPAPSALRAPRAE